MSEATSSENSALSNHPSYGVEALIERLHDQGVVEGRTQGDQMVADANKRAAKIISDAKQEAAEIIKQARQEKASLESAGRDALMLAARDAHLKLREMVMTRFSDEVSRLVGQATSPDEFIAQLILQVAGKARQEAAMDQSPVMTVELPKDVVGLDDLRRNPEELKEGTLAHIVLSVMANLLRDGITYRAVGDQSGGLKIYLQDGSVEVDLTDEAVTAVLLEHLQPRFRALLEGVVK